ncbi:hypothetical protein BH24ACT15_BH24ACT15_39270 [soil metagenome]
MDSCDVIIDHLNPAEVQDGLDRLLNDLALLDIVLSGSDAPT